MELEVWKDVIGYEGIYQVSNKGNVKNLERSVKNRYGYKLINEKELTPGLSKRGYYLVALCTNSVCNSRYIHKLVAESFLNHKPCGFKLVVNHKDFNRLNNHVDNLEIVTNRENTNRKHIKSTSEYVGVSWHKPLLKWRSSIRIEDKTKHLGYFINEYDAHLAYEKALLNITNTN